MSDTKIERTSLFSDVDLQQSKQPWTPFCEGGSFICETCIGSCGVEEFAERKEAYLRSGHKREPLWKQELRNRLAMSVQARASGGSPSRLALNNPIPNASGGPSTKTSSSSAASKTARSQRSLKQRRRRSRPLTRKRHGTGSWSRTGPHSPCRGVLRLRSSIPLQATMASSTRLSLTS